MNITKIPDSEFEIMKVLWNSNTEMTTKKIQERLDNDWKIQTVLTLLKRLEDKEFVKSFRRGKERVFLSILDEDEYLSYETRDFVNRFHENSIVNLFSSFCRGGKIDQSTKNKLKEWLEKE